MILRFSTMFILAAYLRKYWKSPDAITYLASAAIYIQEAKQDWKAITVVMNALMNIQSLRKKVWTSSVIHCIYYQFE